MVLSLSASLQDYLESILDLRESGGKVRVTDLAQKLGLTKASVSQALTQLADKGLIKQEPYGPIELTKAGEFQAKKVRANHDLLFSFLVDVLGVEVQTANADACAIEHAVSDETMDKLAIFLDSYKKGEQKMEPDQTLTLADLKVGQSGLIYKLIAPSDLKQKLLDMGLIKGATVLLQGKAPLGDPLEVVVQGTKLSIRNNEAIYVLIK